MRKASWVLGYHGCDRAVGESVLAGKSELLPSDNDWDWLGAGIYFWEGSAKRALEWAEHAQQHPQFAAAPISEPFALGAVIDLGNCLDLLEAASIAAVADAHAELQSVFASVGAELPKNTGTSPDMIIRRLDCAVINYLHEMDQRRGAEEFDSVRAAFFEGTPLYSGAGFHSHTHIQLCLRKSAHIIGYFRVKARR